jgi:hypothetical protein
MSRTANKLYSEIGAKKTCQTNHINERQSFTNKQHTLIARPR